MTAKAKQAPETVGEMISIKMLAPSHTNPRKRFPQASIDELAISIGSKGIIEPLVVRATSTEYDLKKGTPVYEIVCGERRYRAAKVAKLVDVPCIVRELTDEEVLDIQIHENLHREDVHPMDEALGYEFLQKQLGCDIKELALRVGKTESYVLSRLKLNQLIKEGQDDLDAGHLPITYALEIAKYPAATQASIFASAVYEMKEFWDNTLGRWVKPKRGEKLVPFKTTLAWINNNVLYQLSGAAFDLASTVLRKDGLACVNCPDRTGANVGLFDKGTTGKKDSCLSPTCYNSKRLEHVHVVRSKVAHDSSVEVEDIPLVDTRDWNTDPKFELNGLVKVYGMHDAVVVGKAAKGKHFYNDTAKACSKSTAAVDVDRNNFGQPLTICLKSSACPIHWKTGTTSSAKPQSEKAMTAAREKELDEKRQRREAIWNCSVAEVVRKRIFALAAPKFAKQFKVTGGGKDFVPALTSQMRTLFGYSSHVREVAETIMAGAMDVKSLGLDTSAAAKIAKLSELRQKELLFLYIHGHKGDVASSYWHSQKEVIDIADEWKIDYPLIDAQVRVELSTKKHLDAHKAHLVAVEAGKKSEIPWCFSPNWKRID